MSFKIQNFPILFGQIFGFLIVILILILKVLMVVVEIVLQFIHHYFGLLKIWLFLQNLLGEECIN